MESGVGGSLEFQQGGQGMPGMPTMSEKMRVGLPQVWRSAQMAPRHQISSKLQNMLTFFLLFNTDIEGDLLYFSEEVRIGLKAMQNMFVTLHKILGIQ